MRRSARVVPPPEHSDASAEDSSEDESDLQVDDSADEWQPEARNKKKKGKRGREAVQESDESEEDEDLLDEEDDDDDDLDILEPRQTNSKPQRKKTKRVGNRSKPPTKKKVSAVVTDEDVLAAQAAIEAEEEEERLEQEAATIEAAEMWDQVRKRKQGNIKSAESKTTTNVGPPASLSSWLGISEPVWPTTCTEAMINDRDSLFAGFVYPLTTPSLSTITQLISHLGKAVYPKTIPTNRLPPAMQHLSSHRRGATHDMHAWRCLSLKRGRSGLNGPEDFGLEEGLEDDGEKFGAKEIAKVIKQLGATDVLVVVSRWYGGTMLGPVRFQHIENCARAALSQYLIDEAMVPLKQQLQNLDEQLASLRSQLGNTSAIAKPQYDKLDPEKAERLIGARKKAIEMLQKRLTGSSQTDPKDAAVGAVQIAEETVQQAPTQSQVTGADIVTEEPVIKKEEIDEEEVDLTGWDALE